MSETIRIQMMDEFVIYLNERQADHMVNKSKKKKGLALIEYLIANRESRFPTAACSPLSGTMKT